ncbi:MAG: acyl-CoA dehydrogenase, partial [Xanthomonadaceae bacterium]|nr:acyl-CoA dehydrogenase [Xanthomonadaceae bacterium]
MTKTPRANGSPPREIDPLDLYSVRASLSDEERLVQDSIGKFVDERVLPIIG